MPQSQSAGELRFSRYYRQFSSNYAFNYQTLLFLSFPLLAANLTLDYGREPGTFLQWLGISLFGYAVFLVFALIAKQIFTRREIKAGYYLPTYYLLGIFRGLAIFYSGNELGLLDSSEFTYRVLGSGNYVFCVVPIATILVSNFKRANKTLAELRAQTFRRTKRLNSMKLEIAEQKTEIASRVSGLLNPVIADLIQRVKSSRGSDISKQIAALQDTVETVVRPLSQSVANESSRLSDPRVELERVSLLARLNPKTKLNVSSLFLPGLSAFLLTLMCSSPILTFGQIREGLIVLAFQAFTIYGLIKAAKILTRNLQLGALAALAIELFVYLLITYVILQVISFFNHELYHIAEVRMNSLNLIFACVFFFAQSRYQLLQQSSTALKEVNEELEKLNAQAKQELWINRRRIATVLHGPVQAALYSSAIRLAQSKRPTKKLIQDINNELAEALKALNFEQGDLPSVKSVLQDIVEVWSGICEIYVSIPKKVHDAINKDSNAAESFIEIVREAVSNAIKHGGAKDIEIAARLDGGLIYLQVTNNGKAPSAKQASTGYGTQILNELALSWNLTTTESGKMQFNAAIVANV